MIVTIKQILFPDRWEWYGVGPVALLPGASEAEARASLEEALKGEQFSRRNPEPGEQCWILDLPESEADEEDFTGPLEDLVKETRLRQWWVHPRKAGGTLVFLPATVPSPDYETVTTCDTYGGVGGQTLYILAVPKGAAWRPPEAARWKASDGGIPVPLGTLVWNDSCWEEADGREDGSTVSCGGVTVKFWQTAVKPPWV